MRRMMSSPNVTRTPDLMDALAGGPPVTFGAMALNLDAPALDALLDAVDDRLETATADIALELHRGRRILELELARLLEA